MTRYGTTASDATAVADTDAAFRFVPVRMTPADVARIHGANERISVRNYGELITFYRQLIRSGAGGAPSP